VDPAAEVLLPPLAPPLPESGLLDEHPIPHSATAPRTKVARERLDFMGFSLLTGRGHDGCRSENVVVDVSKIPRPSKMAHTEFPIRTRAAAVRAGTARTRRWPGRRGPRR
jgi:hypothetical protein